MDRIRSTQMRYKWNFLNQFMIFFQNAPGIIKDENVFAKRMLKEKPSWFYQYALEMVIVQDVKFGLLFYNWEYALLLIFIPHLYAAWGIVGTNYWQHDGCDEDHPVNHSRNFTNPLLNFIAFNNGYHGAHHERPDPALESFASLSCGAYPSTVTPGLGTDIPFPISLEDLYLARQAVGLSWKSSSLR